MRMMWLKLSALILTLLPLAAQAQSLTPPAWNVQTWRPGMAADDGALARSALVPGHLDAAGWLGFGYARTPLRLQNSAVGATQTLVGDLGTVEFGGSVGLWDRALVGMSLPIAGVIRGGGLNLAQLATPKAPAMGDLRLDARFQIWSMRDGDLGVAIGLAGIAELPTASRGSMLGGALTGGLEALTTVTWPEWKVDVNLGARGQAAQSLLVHPVDSQGFIVASGGATTIARSGAIWLARAAARRGFDAENFGARLEVQVLGSLLSNALPKGQVVADVLVGGDVRVADAWRIFALAGGAPTSAMGSAGMRVAAGVQFDSRKINRDQDADGIEDKDDKCPTEGEDKDGFEDSDGCPDQDDDGDGILDEADKCPRLAEDKDGFEDGDGCPELDNDKDGVADADDKCPKVAEDLDNFEDADGCPEPDNDKDGILDVDDLCPSSPETKNGFEDADGCPDVPPPPKVEPPKVEPPKVETPKAEPPKVEPSKAMTGKGTRKSGHVGKAHGGSSKAKTRKK